MEAKRCCSICGTQDKALRPYGENNADICFLCAMRPENRARTIVAICQRMQTQGEAAVEANEEELKQI